MTQCRFSGMSNTAHADELAEPTDPYMLDSPAFEQGLSACACDRPTLPRHCGSPVRTVLVGLASGLIVVGLAVVAMR